MATLAGTRVKDTYQGMLKTSDASALTTSLKVIEDGLGNSSALSLSTSAVKASTLQIDSVTGSSSSDNALVWNSTSKAVEYRAFPSNATVSTTVGGTTSPTITIEAADASSTTVTFAGGAGVDLSRSGNTITISAGDTATLEVDGQITLTSSDSGKVILIDAASLAGSNIILPTAAAGRTFEFLIKTGSTTPFEIRTSTGDLFYGRAILADSSNTYVEHSTAAESFAATTNIIKIDSNGTTNGGQEGDRITIRAVDATYWLVSAELTTSGNATSAGSVFSSTVTPP